MPSVEEIQDVRRQKGGWDVMGSCDTDKLLLESLTLYELRFLYCSFLHQLPCRRTAQPKNGELGGSWPEQGHQVKMFASISVTIRSTCDIHWGKQ